MEWNNNMPLKLLEDVPASFVSSDLKRIQAIIDKDKYACSTMLGRDLCGQYAPFCDLCDRSMPNPCAVAFVRMRQSEDTRSEVALTAHDEVNEEKPSERADDAEQHQESSTTPQKKRIRIAIAKRKD